MASNTGQNKAIAAKPTTSRRFESFRRPSEMAPASHQMTKTLAITRSVPRARLATATAFTALLLAAGGIDFMLLIVDAP